MTMVQDGDVVIKNIFGIISFIRSLRTILNNVFGRPVVEYADVSMWRHAAEEERRSKDHRYSLNNGDFSDMDDDVRRRMTLLLVMLWKGEFSLIRMDTHS